MIARLTSFSGDAGSLRDGARIYEQQVLPWLRDATGFRGVTILHDGAEEAIGITYWESEEDAIADVMRAVGSSQLAAESYEVLLALGPAPTVES